MRKQLEEKLDLLYIIDEFDIVYQKIALENNDLENYQFLKVFLKYLKILEFIGQIYYLYQGKHNTKK